MANDLAGHVRRALWRIVNPRSRAGLFLRLAVAISAAISAADALGLFGG